MPPYFLFDFILKLYYNIKNGSDIMEDKQEESLVEILIKTFPLSRILILLLIWLIILGNLIHIGIIK